MEKEYIIIYIGCGAVQKEFKIQLELKQVDEWNEKRINAMSLVPEPLSGVLVGPRTVVQIFSTGDLIGLKNTFVNDSSTETKMYNIGCLDNPSLWRGTIRSFVVMTYDHYNSIYGIKYCDSHTQCDSTEYCLCPHGQEHPSWCPNSKRRCLNRGYFVNEMPFELLSTDNVDVNCMNEQMRKYGGNLSDGTLNEFAIKCALEKRKTIEGFGGVNSNSLWIVGIILLILAIWYLSSH